MALFQKSVLNKFIKSQDTVKIEAAYQRFSDNFQKAERQAEIRSMKEEEYQDGFLDDLFVNILGYVKRPNAGFNLVREKKNEADSKKADGAILKNDMPLAVIELKGTDTTDLDKVTNQGFGYKNNHKECVYVVISNFEKLRFFIHHAVDYIEFNLFTLSKEDFTTLWLCLHSDNLLDNIPAKIKAESVVKEEDITKNLYKDYSTFKQELWQSIVNLNPEGDPLMFYKKTQKLIDRFLFIFFAEDAGLLPPNSISRMVERWQMLKDEDAYKPLYDIFKQYFGYINTGRPGKTPQDEIFAYNGGLMLEDDVLESITISDDVLLKHVSRLTTYDFSSEVDVNILGHIFENSLNDIEAVTAELEGQEIDKSKTKRKKDGVFYTPKYITKYIVDNTVGKLCDEKKVELNIIDEEYAKGRTNRKKETLKQLDENLQAYRNWLLNITICDPACGSGAFLNQALEFLIAEHRYIDELQAKLMGDSLILSDVEKSILENNIYGVDLNDESVEIAKLSLWLRTAQKGRKLNSLNSNIKCGNSLIDDTKVAGDKAFNWQQEFPTVFENGGFDVVIGNPPYVRVQNLNYKEIDFYKMSYVAAHKRIDISLLFFEKGFKILKANGLLAYITTIQFLNADYGRKIRGFLLEKRILEFIDYNGLQVFEGATTYPGILILKNCSPGIFHYRKMFEIGPSKLCENIVNYLKIDPRNLTDEVWVLEENNRSDLLKKLEKNFIKLKKIANPCTGLTTGADGVFVIKHDEVEKLNLESQILLPVVRGRNINRGRINNKLDYVIYPYELINEKTELISLEVLKRIYPKTFNYLFERRDILANRLDSRKEMGFDSDWYKLVRKGKLDLFKSVKILTPGLSKRNRFAIDNIGMTYLCGGAGVFGLVQNKIDNDILLSILNSKVVEYYLHSISTKKQGGYFSYLNRFLEEIPLPKKTNDNLKELSIKSQRLLATLNKIEGDFLKFIEITKNNIQLSDKIINWSDLNFKDFITELNKCLKSSNIEILVKKEEFEWMELFEENKKQALELKTQIDKTDKEIDHMVYELYGLSEEEIQIIENS